MRLVIYRQTLGSSDKFLPMCICSGQVRSVFVRGHSSGGFKVWMTLPELCCIPTPAGLPSGPYRARLLRAGMQEQRSSVRKHSVGISGESQTRQARAVYAVNLTSALEAPASSITPHPLTPFSTSLHHTGPALTFVCLWWLWTLFTRLC